MFHVVLVLLSQACVLLLHGCGMPKPPKDGTTTVIHGSEQGGGTEHDTLPSQPPFCELMQPVIADLRRSLGNTNVECLQLDFNEVGRFGPRSNVMESSLDSACFASLERYSAMVRPSKRSLGAIGRKISADLQIKQNGLIDLTEYGIVPNMYRVEGVRGAATARIEIGFAKPEVSAIRDLGYTLTRIANNRNTHVSVRDSIRSCTVQLCGEDTIFTSNVISARPEVIITIPRGSATGIQPILREGERVGITTPGPGTFVLRPMQPINIAAQVSPSRNTMIGHELCEPSPLTCKKVERNSIEANYIGCGRSGGRSSTTVACKLQLMSRGYDQDVRINVRSNNYEGSTLIDGLSASHTPAWAELAGVTVRGYGRATLLAGQPVDLTLFYENVSIETSKVSQINIRLVAEHDIKIDFRGLDILEDVSSVEHVQCKSTR